MKRRVTCWMRSNDDCGATHARLHPRSARRIGELSTALDKRPTDDERNNGVMFKTAALADAGITPMSASRYERVAAIPDPEFQ